MVRIVYLLLLQILLIGCGVSAESIKGDMANSSSNYWQGVSKEEAISIAKDYMVKNKIKIYSLKPKSVNLARNKYTSNEHSFYYVNDPKYQNKTLTVWEVNFSCKAPGLLPVALPCSVHVNAEDGIVVFEHMDTM